MTPMSQTVYNFAPVLRCCQTVAQLHDKKVISEVPGSNSHQQTHDYNVTCSGPLITAWLAAVLCNALAYDHYEKLGANHYRYMYSHTVDTFGMMNLR